MISCRELEGKIGGWKGIRESTGDTMSDVVVTSEW